MRILRNWQTLRVIEGNVYHWYCCGAGNARIFAAACSPAMTIYAEGFVETWPGKIDASTTKRLPVP